MNLLQRDLYSRQHTLGCAFESARALRTEYTAEIESKLNFSKQTQCSNRRNPCKQVVVNKFAHLATLVDQFANCADKQLSQCETVCTVHAMPQKCSPSPHPKPAAQVNSTQPPQQQQEHEVNYRWATTATSTATMHEFAYINYKVCINLPCAKSLFARALPRTPSRYWCPPRNCGCANKSTSCCGFRQFAKKT